MSEHEVDPPSRAQNPSATYRTKMAAVENRFLRLLLFLLGALSLPLALAGAFLPLLPTTPFLLLAAWCFLKSSPKAYQWLYRQPLLGRALRDWKERRAISRPSRWMALGFIAVSLAGIWIRVDVIFIKVFLTALLLGVSLFIITRPTS